MLSSQRTLRHYLTLLFWLMCSPCRGFGATVHHVINTDDRNSPGTLRNAIGNAESGDTIDFQLSNCPCTITLSLGPLVIDTAITITGLGAKDLAISGNGGQVMHIDAAKVTTISGIEIRDANSMTALVVDSDTILSGMIFRKNHVSTTIGSYSGGGAIQNSANLLVKNSLFEDNEFRLWHGGAISSHFGSLQLVNSTFINNTAGSCGAVLMDSGVVTNSIFANNHALDDPGEGDGGAICSTFETTIVSSTIVNNSAVAGGGIYREAGSLQLANSVIANNTAAYGPDFAGEFFSLGNNLISNRKDSFGSRKSTCNPAVDSLPADLPEQNPRLAPLHISDITGLPIVTPNPGSPLIDAISAGGSNCDGIDVPKTDARGITRPQGVGADIGATEFLPNDDRIFCSGIDVLGCTPLR